MHIISAADFPLFCSKMPYSAGRMLASKIAYSARNSVVRIYPSLPVTRFPALTDFLFSIGGLICSIHVQLLHFFFGSFHCSKA